MASPNSAATELVVLEVDSSEKPVSVSRLSDTYQDSVEPRILRLTRHRLHFTSLINGRKSIYNPGREYAFHRAVPLFDGTVFITGASGENYMHHSCMLYNGKQVLYREESEQGISTFSLVANNKEVFLIGGKSCEVYDLESKKINRIEAPMNQHISGGACAFNSNVLLVGGIQCQSVEMYLHDEKHWTEVTSLTESLYNVACIQVTDQEVLLFGAGTRQTWRLNVETRSLTGSGELPESVHDSNMIENVPVRYKGAVYCYVGEVDPVLLKYDIAGGVWSQLQQARSGGCCSLL